MKESFLYQLAHVAPFSLVDYYFADAVQRQYKGCSPYHKAIVFLLMFVSRNGHLCLDLDHLDELIDLHLLDQAMKIQLATYLQPIDFSDELVEKVEHGLSLFNRPFILKNRKIYFQKNYLYQQEIIKNVQRLASFPKSQLLHTCDQLNEEQQCALQTALTTPFSIIAGGPGTGKTYTASMIAKAFADNKKGKIIVGAPTGKAALHLYGKIRGSLNSDIEIEYGTLHRILNVRSNDHQIQTGCGLKGDLILIDECSMIDAGMFATLLSSIREGSTLVLMGDPDQLFSVRQGSIFADLLTFSKQTALFPSTELRTSLRSASSSILELAQKIKTGDSSGVIEIVKKEHPFPCTHERIFQEGIARFPHPTNMKPDCRELLRKLGEFQILSSLRKGEFGVETINEEFSRYFAEQHREGIYLPRPIILTRTDYDQELFNGDIGILIEHQGRSTAHFLKNNEIVEIKEEQLPRYEFAYCLTVHKSQGSEYDHVLLLLPKGSEFFGREILYTAVTRAKQSLQILGDHEQIYQAVLKKTLRSSGVI